MRITLYFLLFLVTNSAFSQSNVTLTDQEYQKLHDRARLLINSNIDSSFIYANKIAQSNNNLHKSFAYGIKSYLYQLKGDSIKSKESYVIALKQLEKVLPSKNKIQFHANVLNLGGLADWKRGNYIQAINKYQQGKKLSESIHDWKQIVKFNSNIALIYGETNNYKLAISITKESEKFISNNKNLYDENEFNQFKSNNNINLGNYYENYYLSNPKKKILLDSAFYFYQKAIIFSKENLENKLKAQKNIGDIYFFKRDFEKSEKMYLNTLIIAKQNDLYFENYNANYNLGFLYYNLKNYKKALVCFQKVDSINDKYKWNSLEYINSNYYQAMIYNIYKNADKSLKYSKIYLDNYETFEFELNNKISNINSKLGRQDLQKDMIALQERYKRENVLRYVLVFSAIIIILFFFVKNHIEKNNANKKVKLLIEEFKNKEINLDIDELKYSLIDNNKLNLDTTPNNPKSVLLLNVEKEKDILEKLKKLEEKHEYLKEDYTQQYVAKKIKTNTTYLSYVINKNFRKTFSEYSNELKINYVISQMVTKPTYRKYTTLAIAESVGFKNADSFTSSFKKKTGVTPYQFINEIKKRELL